MFIIFGAKTVKTHLKSGLSLRRRCDRCHYLSDLREHSFRKYFTLFFIPVLPISKGESMLICTRCGAAYYIQAEDYLASELGNAIGDKKMGSASGAEKMVIPCGYCGGRLRVPVMAGHKLIVTCPHCNRKFEV
jgi:hypothetical protein